MFGPTGPNKAVTLNSSQPQGQLPAAAYQTQYSGGYGQGYGQIQPQQPIYPNYYTNPLLPHYAPENLGSSQFKCAVITSTVMNVLLFFIFGVSIGYFFVIKIIHHVPSEPWGDEDERDLSLRLRAREEEYGSVDAVTNGGLTVTFPLSFFCLYVSYYDCCLTCSNAITTGKLMAWMILSLIIILLTLLQLIFHWITLIDLHPTNDVIAKSWLVTKATTDPKLDVDTESFISYYDSWYKSAMAVGIIEIIILMIRLVIVIFILVTRNSVISTETGYGGAVYSSSPNTDPQHQQQVGVVPSSVNAYDPSYPSPPTEEASAGAVPVTV